MINRCPLWPIIVTSSFAVATLIFLVSPAAAHVYGIVELAEIRDSPVLAHRRVRRPLLPVA